MKPLFVLLGVFLVTVLCYTLLGKPIEYQYAGRVGMCAMLMFTSIGHFIFKKGMVKMMPEFIPFKSFLVIATGILEVLTGLILLLPFYTKATGWFLVGFFICILPANINAAIHKVDYQKPDGVGPGLNYLWFRIPLQLFFIAWIYWAAIKAN